MTGAGIVSAIGIGKHATLQALLRGESGVAHIRHLPTGHDEFPVGEVPLSNERLAALAGVGYPSDGLRTVLLGILAAREAVEEAALTPALLRRAAFISGTTVGGMDKTERHFKKVIDSNTETDEARELRYNDCGYSTELIADTLGRFSMVTTTSTACSSAANALILGANLIRAGVVDIAVVGGSEALSRFHLNGFNTLMILDTDRCRPFDRDRKGINLGEGAAYLVIESESSMRRRSARPLARLSGYANTCDAFHQTASSDNGEGAYLSMTGAMAMAGLSPKSISYINAHGTGTPNNDATELAAMQRVWPEGLPPFSSTKPMTGHTTSASGSIESVICLLAMNHGFLPPSLGVETPIAEGAMPVTEPTYARLTHVLNNSFGFGGNDSTIIFTKA